MRATRVISAGHGDAQDPEGLTRLRRRIFRAVAVVMPSASALIALVAVLSSTPGLLAWSALGAATAVVAILQMAVGSSDLRTLALAHAVATVLAALAAPSASVPGVVVGSAVATVILLTLMGRDRGTLVTLVLSFGLYGAAMLVASDPVGLIGLLVLAGAGAVSWSVLTGLVVELRTGEGSYRRLFDRVPVGLYRTALSGEILDANHALGEIFGVPRDEIIGVNARELLADPADLDRLRGELAGGRDSLVIDLLFGRSDGQRLWVRDRTRAVRDAQGRVVWYEGELQDITDEKSHLEELERLVKSKSELIGAVSHELRTPLTAVVGFLDVLVGSMKGSDPEHRELLTMAVEQAHEVAGIVDDLLTAARIDNRELVIHPEGFVVADAIHSAVTSLGPVALDAVEVESDLSIHADAGRVRQILRNLIGNAARHGAPPIRVEAASAEDGQVLIIVADRGNGVPPGASELIFEAFYSGATASSQPGSIGLGLSVSRRLARLMGGDLEHRRLGPETQFVLTLPKIPEERAA